MVEEGYKWYVLRAVSGKETKVRETIELEMQRCVEGYGANVAQVYIPTEKIVSVRNGKRVVKERAYLPGYVLVHANLVGETAHKLKAVTYVIDFLGRPGFPTALQQSEVNRMLGTVDDMKDENDEIMFSFSIGETVKVTEGPFAGFGGVVDDINLDKKKLTVSVKVFGRNTPLSLGFTQVEKE